MLKNDNEKVMRLAHQILTKSIWPAKLPKLEDAFDVTFVLIEALIKSNAENPKDREGMIKYVEERFASFMAMMKEGN